MLEDKIINNMNDYLYKVAKVLASWLGDMLPRSGENWWEECVIGNLSYNQRELAIRKKFSKLTDFDLVALLMIADKSWYTMRGYAYLPTSERECLRNVMTVRNNWTHCSAELPDKETIVSDIEKLHCFFIQMGCTEFASSLDEFRAEVEKSEMGSVKLINRNNPQVPELHTKTAEIQEKSIVRIVGTPEITGMVFSIVSLGSTRKYEVFVDGAIKTYYEGQIEPIDDAPKHKWVDIETLRCYLSAYQINNPSSGNLYSLNSARIDFVPYQFRPALKLIKADEPRILIADSVGVGKTIEAGLIIKELQARNDLENIMIICPKPLVADRKWEEEMKRFDEEFIPLNGEELRQIISDTDRDGEWPVRYGKTIVPYSILDSRAYYGEEKRRGKKYGLVDLDPAPHFDLVIIDEAHHLRNGSMDKEKAFAYKCVHYFCEHADAVVMLTATPLQTSDDDLYTLLNLLRPDVVIDKKSFEIMARPNPFISKSSHIVRAAKDNWQFDALETLKGVLNTQWGENVIAQNPLFNEIQSVLKNDSVSREERVKLITDIESLHSFNSMLNRTRRKDIQDFCVRRTYTLESDFTPEQKELHDALLTFEVAALSKLHGGRGVKFMMSTIRRQAASCIFGLAPHICSLVERRFDQLLEDPDWELEQEDFKNVDITEFKSMTAHILELANNLPDEDPKFESVMEIIREKQKSENNKIIIFSTFRFTLSYIKRKLKASGIRVEQIDGSVDNEKRLELRHRFGLSKDDINAVDILLFTEVGSEGLDYQFCDTMINYDLPWNPMRIEQRIGRIDRRGQMSEAVNIYNVITGGTVDADIYNRCLSRIGVFENSIGECEEILGEIGRQIELIALDSTLTSEERREKLEQIADNEIRKAQEINRLESEEKELFGFDLSNYTLSREIQEAESPFLTPLSIQHLVEMYLNKCLGNGAYIKGDSELKTIRLSVDARSKLLVDFRKLSGVRNCLGRKWEAYLKGKNPIHQITFDADTAEKNRNAFFITTVHPLVKQAAAYFASNQVVYIHLEYHSNEIPAGDYPMSIYAWDYVGLRSNFKLVVVCEDARLEVVLPEYILTSSSVTYTTEVPQDCWRTLEERHIALWFEEKQRHIESIRQVAVFKLESLKNNFNNRKSVITRKIAEAKDSRIETMYKSELENASQKYEQKVSEIETQIARADIHTTLIANGVITVKS